MFDRLVESREAGAVPSRRNYFVVSTLAMSVLALTGIVVSIFADDYSMDARLELSELIAPVEMAQVTPEQPRQPMPRTQRTSTLPTREIAQASVDDTRSVPTNISTTPNTHLSIPLDGRFKIGPTDLNRPSVGGEAGTGSSRGTGDPGTGSGLGGSTVAAFPPEDATPPRSIKKLDPKPQTGGVLNGKAAYLPKPAYPAPALAVNAQGQVTVQVLLDETGKVISATAVSGSPLLRGAAIEAARRARFTPTLLSGIPVKVTGVIVYNFTRG